MPIRLNVAAAIVRQGQILLVEFDDESGLHYNLPGGGVEPGETLHEAVKREVLEECSAQVEQIGAVLMLWEYIGSRQKQKYGDSHKVAIVFPCILKPESQPSFPASPDTHQTGIRWVALEELHTIPLIPDIAAQLVGLLQSEGLRPVDIIWAK